MEAIYRYHGSSISALGTKPLWTGRLEDQFSISSQTWPWSLPVSPTQIAILQYVASFSLCAWTAADVLKSRKECRKKTKLTLNSWIAILTQPLLLTVLVTELVFARQRYSGEVSQAHDIGMISTAISTSLAVCTSIARRSPSTSRGLYHLAAAVLFYARSAESTVRPDRLSLSIPVLFLVAFFFDLQAPFTKTIVEFPFAELSWFQGITFNWLEPLINASRRKQLGKYDIWHVDETLSVQSSLHGLLRTALADRTTPRSFLWFELRAYKGNLIFSGALELVGVLGRLVQPWLLGLFLRSPSLDVVGYMLFTRLLSALCTNLSLYSVKVMAAKLKSSLTALIYEMTLGLPAGARSPDLAPANLAEVDTQRISDFLPLLHSLWSLPLRVVIALACIALSVGWIGVSLGVLILFMALPLVSFQSKKMQQGLVKLMQRKDERTGLTSEILEKIKTIVLCGYQNVFLDKLDKARSREMDAVAGLAVLQSLIYATLEVVPELMTSAAFFSAYYFSGRNLDADLLFPTLGFFIIAKTALSSMSPVLTMYLTCEASFRRVHDCLIMPQANEASCPPRDQRKSATPGLCAFDASFGRDGVVVASGLSLDIASPSIIALAGPSGSGKSTTLQGLMGFLIPLSGTVHVEGSIAYASQVPWLINGTVRDNIVLLRKFKPNLYRSIIQACALDIDLAALPDGDETNLAGVGSRLSGGQMSRISLARALYSQADIVLLDDPLAALDANVKAHIVSHVFALGGILSNSICVVATGCEVLLRVAHRQVSIEHRQFRHVPRCEPLVKIHGDDGFVAETGLKDDAIVMTEELLGSVDSSSRGGSGSDDVPDSDHLMEDIEPGLYESSESDPSVKILSRPKCKSYSTWLKMAEPKGWIVILVLVVLGKISSGLSTYMLEKVADGTNNTIPVYLSCFTLIGMIQSFCSAGFLLTAYYLCLIPAGKKMHHKLSSAMTQSSLHYFTTTPVGDMLNYFTNDLSKIDGNLASSFLGLMISGSSLALSLFILVIPSPAMLVFLVPLALMYLRVQNRYLDAACQLRRLELSTRGEVINTIQESWAGYQTIIVHGQRNEFLRRHYTVVNDNISAMVVAAGLETWLVMRLDVIGSFVQVFTALGLIWLQLDPSPRGFIMNYAMQITVLLQVIVRCRTNLDLDIISVDRIQEFCEKVEAPASPATAYVPSPGWPEKGVLEFKNLSAAYEGAEQLCIQDINVTITASQKVAVVGRTGSGKSSLALAFLGHLHLTGGRIEIDGVDISLVAPDTLTSKIAVVPQTAAVFVGTLRDNLDPKGEFEDEDILMVTETLGLNRLLGRKDNILDMTVGNSSNNLSEGQIQLLAIGRAILLRRNILVLDEATASVDQETEAILHEVLMKKLTSCTTLAIVHRLEKIACDFLNPHFIDKQPFENVQLIPYAKQRDYDRVLVLERGRVASFGSPKELLGDPESPLSRLVRSESRKAEE